MSSTEKFKMNDGDWICSDTQYVHLVLQFLTLDTFITSYLFSLFERCTNVKKYMRIIIPVILIIMLVILKHDDLNSSPIPIPKLALLLSVKKWFHGQLKVVFY